MLQVKDQVNFVLRDGKHGSNNNVVKGGKVYSEQDNTAHRERIKGGVGSSGRYLLCQLWFQERSFQGAGNEGRHDEG